MGPELDPYFANLLNDYDDIEDMCNQLGLNVDEILADEDFGDDD